MMAVDDEGNSYVLAPDPMAGEVTEALKDVVLGKPESLITFVKDRAGHDLRYAMDPTKIMTELVWKPKYTFETGIGPTIRWNLEHQEWLQNIISGEYLRFMEKNYR